MTIRERYLSCKVILESQTMKQITEEILAELSKPLPESAISWKAGIKSEDKTQAQAIPYIKAPVVQDLLDKVLGPANWKPEYVEVHSNGVLLAVRCILSIFVEGQWVGKSDAAPVLLPQGSHGLEMAVKGAYSDALKRAAVHWGVMRYMYAYRPEWVEIDPERGRLLVVPPLSAEFLPEGAQVQSKAPNAQRERTPEQPRELPKPPSATAEAAVAQPQAEQNPAAAPTEPVKDAAASQAPATDAPAQEQKPREDKAPQAQPVAAAPAPSVAKSTPAAAAPAHEVKPTKNAPSGSVARPQGLTADETKVVDELIGKMEKIPLNMIQSYVEGPKAKEKLGEPARKYLLDLLAREAKLRDPAAT